MARQPLPVPPQQEIVPPEPAQEPQAPSYGEDLWPFNEKRCGCHEDTLVILQKSEVHGVFIQCSGCGRAYTRREIK